MIAKLVLDASSWNESMQKAASETEAQTGKMESAFEAVNGTISKIGAALAGMEIAAKIKEFAEEAITASDQIGKFRSALVTLRGDGEETPKFLEHIEELAAKSPFAFPELAAAAQKMVQLDMSLKDASATMDAIVAFGTALKLPGDNVNAIADAMARLAAGAPPMRALNALAADGVPVWQMLADKMGVSIPEAQAELKKGLIGTQEVIQTLTEGMSEYSSRAVGWSETWRGAMKELQTAVHQAMAAVGDDLKATLNELAAPLLKQLAADVKSFTESWKELPTPVKDAIIAFGAFVTAAAAA